MRKFLRRALVPRWDVATSRRVHPLRLMRFALPLFGLMTVVSFVVHPGIAGAQTSTEAAASASLVSEPSAGTDGDGLTSGNVITCVLQVNNPHQSSHVLGAVNVTATWTCTEPVSYLSLTVDLFWQGLQYASGTAEAGGRAYIQGNAATGCIPGYWHATASGTVVFPPGYQPQSSFLAVQSPTVLISCT